MWPFKPKSKPLPIPPFRAPPEPEKPPEPMEVKEGSLSDIGIDEQTRTGIHRAWNRFTQKF